jgi:hypothetical protein
MPKPLKKSPAVTHRPEKYDDTPAPEPPASEEEIRQGYKRIPAGPLGDKKRPS